MEVFLRELGSSHECFRNSIGVYSPKPPNNEQNPKQEPKQSTAYLYHVKPINHEYTISTYASWSGSQAAVDWRIEKANGALNAAKDIIANPPKNSSQTPITEPILLLSRRQGTPMN